MRLAKAIATGELIDALSGDYEIAIEKTTCCPHCSNPVHWRSGSKIRRKDKIMITPPYWAHYPGCDKNCSLYSGSNAIAVSGGKGSGRGQREVLMQERFWQIFQLATQGINELEAIFWRDHLMNNLNLPDKRRKLRPPVSKSIRELYLDIFLGQVRRKIVDSQGEIKIAINNNNNQEKSIALEAFSFLLIEKNIAFLDNIILCSLREDGKDIALDDISEEQLSVISNQAINFIISRFSTTYFKEAYLIESSK